MGSQEQPHQGAPQQQQQQEDQNQEQQQDELAQQHEPQQQKEEEQEEELDALHSKYWAPDWSFKAFVAAAIPEKFGLRDGSSSFFEGGGCGPGRALPLRLEAACSFATSETSSSKPSRLNDKP